MLDTSGTQAGIRAAEPGERARLRGWKEIGRHFGVDERTAKRWEQARGLPVHRLPGEARAPVYAFADELDQWVARSRAEADMEPAPAAHRPAAPLPHAVLWRRVAPLLLLLLLGSALWFGWRASEQARLAEARTGDLVRLAAGQVAALNDQLDSAPGPVAVRAALAADAVSVLGRIATLEGAKPPLRREAAEAFRRLAVLQGAIDRPSLRDREAARRSLDAARALVAEDPAPDAARIRAAILVEAARLASGAGALAEAEALLAEAEGVALAEGAGALAADWWLARAELASWAGDHEAALAAARRVAPEPADTPVVTLRQLRARDLEAEALYYRGALAEALAGYRETLAAAEAASARWPDDIRLRWALLRQQWNLGSTMVTAGDPRLALPLLGAALDGWQALARADPSDAALGFWVRATRLSYGQALAAAGDRTAAAGVLSEAVAERRQWLADRPADADRRRMLVKGLASLGDALAGLDRAREACPLYAEARRLLEGMAADGQRTGLDRDETERLIAAAETRHCPAAETHQARAAPARG